MQKKRFLLIQRRKEHFLFLLVLMKNHPYWY